MAITKSKKEQLIEAYLEQLSTSRAIVFSEYRGTNVQQIQKQCRKAVFLLTE